MAQAPKWPVPPTARSALTWDSAHFVEGITTATPWSWHARLSTGYLYEPGITRRVSQFRGDIQLGIGLPFRLEVALALPLGFTLDEYASGGLGGGFGVGDLQPSLLWCLRDASQGGLGLLVGVTPMVPTGDHHTLMSEGGFALESLVSLAFQTLGSRVSVNLAYRLRPEHSTHDSENSFEQDDDLIWRAAIRVPRKYDAAWSIEAQGAIGLATAEGIWPSSASRPVEVGAGLDFPVSRVHRLGVFVMAGVAGRVSSTVHLGLRFSWQPVLPDEDEDGITGASDQCPLIREDKDGFEDGDGCPDLDNDQDGFPDDEDRCPTTPAADAFSEDGC